MIGIVSRGKHQPRKARHSVLVLAVMALATVIAVGGCSKKQKKPKYVERPVAQIYDTAMKQLRFKHYKFAAAAFDEVERQHPYSVWARRSQLMAAYSHYLGNDYDEAILSAQRFLALHPGNKGAPYAYYLIAICYYEQISDVGRDQKMTEQALVSLNELVRRFPDTEYARDARLKLELTLDHLAGKEMEIGRWYLKHGHYLAAILRFRTVVERYGRTTHVPEALHRLSECYLALGIVPEAQAAAAVLGRNFPDSDWYRDSYAMLEGTGAEGKGYAREKEKKSFLARVWNKVF